MEERNIDFNIYIVSLKKRKKIMLSIAITLMCIISLVVYLLPSVYKSSATILIEQQEIPREMVMSTVTSYASERIRTIQALVMSRGNLFEIIDKFNLYESERKRETSEAIIARMRQDTYLKLISADVVDPSSGRASSATIAFSLSFEGENPAQVQRVVSELTSLYLNKNLENRANKAEETSAFFREEAGRIKLIISELEERLAIFKQKNAKMLPEVQQMNMQILQRIEGNLLATKTTLTNLEDRKFYLEGILTQISPDNPLVQSVSTRLKLLQSQYASIVSRYSEFHPDVIAVKSEIESLQSGSNLNVANDFAKELKKLQSQYELLGKKYTEKHPDIMALQTKISLLSDRLKEAKKNESDKSLANDYLIDTPDNPAYITLKAQLDSVTNEIVTLKSLKLEYFKKQENLEAVMLSAPQIEREYLVLQRDYSNALRRHQDVKAKQRTADIAKQLETESKGERFTLIDPAILPEAPVSPNRPMILLLGFIMSIGAAVGFALFSDAISGTVRGLHGVQRALGMTPLSVLPYQLNMDDIANKNKANNKLVLIILGVIFIAAIIVHFLVHPLDVLWFRVMRKADWLFD